MKDFVADALAGNWPLHAGIADAGYEAFRAVVQLPEGVDEMVARQQSDAIVRAVVVASTFEAHPVAWEFKQRDPETNQWNLVMQRDRLAPGSQVQDERALIYRHAAAAIEPAHSIAGYVGESAMESYQSGGKRPLMLYPDSESVSEPVRLVLLSPEAAAQHAALEERCRALEARLAQAQVAGAALARALQASADWVKDCVNEVVHPVAHLSTTLGATAEGLGSTSVAIFRQAADALTEQAST